MVDCSPGLGEAPSTTQTNTEAEVWALSSLVIQEAGSSALGDGRTTPFLEKSASLRENLPPFLPFDAMGIPWLVALPSMATSFGTFLHC